MLDADGEEVSGDDADDSVSDELQESEDDVSDAGPLDDFMAEDDVGDEEASDDAADETTDDSQGDEDDSVVEMTDLVDEDEAVEFVDVESKILAMIGDQVIATMAPDHENAATVQSKAFNKGFRHSIATQGLRKALVSAGFKPKRILVKNVVAAATKRGAKDVARQVAAAESAKAQRFAKCLEIATAGGMIGMFSKENAGVLHTELSKVLAAINVANPKKVAKTVLAKALAQHNKAIVTVATDLMKRKDDVLSSYQEQIASMGGIIVAEAEDDEDEDENVDSVDETDTVESRLSNPMRQSTKIRSKETASTKPQTTATPWNGQLFS